MAPPLEVEYTRNRHMAPPDPSSCSRSLNRRFGRPRKGLGDRPAPVSLYTTVERERIEASRAPGAGDTRFRSTRFYLKPGEPSVSAAHSARASDTTPFVDDGLTLAEKRTY